jgi:2-oxoglutarate ferredoxin oxidoreductase subunit alpha
LRRFWSGNIAVAEGALKAGCKFYAGYPITPSSDLMEHMVRRLPENGGVFIQTEDEIAAINMIIGASIAGLKSMTATSGPGFSLMQEGIGYAVMAEVPIVIVDVMRLGPATGQATKSGQGDIMQARWGRHGDQYVVIYTASTVQECLELSIEAFNTAERLRLPVILLVEEIVAHLWESIDVKKRYEIFDRRLSKNIGTPFFGPKDSLVPPMPVLGEGLDALYTGSTHDEYGYRRTQDPIAHSDLVFRFKEKVESVKSEIFRYTVEKEPNMKIGFISYGSVARSVMEAVYRLRDDGISSGYLKLNTLWPIDYEVLDDFTNDCEIVIVPEINLGQIIYDVRSIRRRGIFGFNKVGGGEPIGPVELVRYSMEVLRRYEA